MYVLGYFLLAVSKVLDLILLFFMWVIIARAVLSWVSPDPYNPIVRFYSYRYGACFISHSRGHSGGFRGN